MKTRDIARAAVLVALAVALSPLFIPVGIAKCYPAQHMVNVLAAVLLGPGYAVWIAFCAALLRNLFGLGTLLAFPGGMIGALLAGLAFRLFRRSWAAALGEVIGTGLLGALASAWIVAPLLLQKAVATGTLVVAFSLSALAGALIALLLLPILRKAGLWRPE